MSTKESTIEYIVGQLGGAGKISIKKMFGEYGLYCNGVIVALVCDDVLFIKQTKNGCSYVGNVKYGIAYPGAKPFIVVDDKIEDEEWMAGLIKVTFDELSKTPRKKKANKKK